MGDDEFFGTVGQSSSGASRAIRNPLTLDELISFSRQLLNIAFTLFWRDDAATGVLQTQPQVAQVAGPPGVRCSWEVVREKVTRCLVGIHARDSRKPFVPVDHWLVTSQLDMNSFVEAAVYVPVLLIVIWPRLTSSSQSRGPTDIEPDTAAAARPLQAANRGDVAPPGNSEQHSVRDSV